MYFMKDANDVETKNYWLRELLFFALLLNPVFVFSQEAPYSIDTIQIKSGILNESRSIIVYKPRHISQSDTVKFMYFLDGEYSGYRFRKITDQFGDTISDIIGIGIINTDRRRDMLYVNGAGKFLDFISSELIPAVEKNYRTRERILFGHSFAGSFTIYALLNKPDFFDYFIASSPTPIMALIKGESFLHVDSLCKEKKVLCFSYGSNDMGQVRKWAVRLKNNLDGLKFMHFAWYFNEFEGKNHNNSDIPALNNGLRICKE